MCILKIGLCPLPDEWYGTIPSSRITGIRACLRRGKGVVESRGLNSNELLILPFERRPKKAKGKVEGRGKHAVLGLGSEDGKPVRVREILQEKAVFHPHRHAEID